MGSYKLPSSKSTKHDADDFGIGLNSEFVHVCRQKSKSTQVKFLALGIPSKKNMPRFVEPCFFQTACWLFAFFFLFFFARTVKIILTIFFRFFLHDSHGPNKIVWEVESCPLSIVGASWFANTSKLRACCLEPLQICAQGFAKLAQWVFDDLYRLSSFSRSEGKR